MMIRSLVIILLHEPDYEAYNKHHCLLRAYLLQVTDIVVECFEAELNTLQERKELERDYIYCHSFVYHIHTNADTRKQM